MPRRHLGIDYFAPARLDEALGFVTYVPRVGETSLTFQVDVFGLADERLKASATVVVVCVTAPAFEKRPLPRLIRDAVAPFVMEPAAAREASRSARQALAGQTIFQ
jgi:acyl-CoA thioesterase FadM